MPKNIWVVFGMSNHIQLKTLVSFILYLINNYVQQIWFFLEIFMIKESCILMVQYFLLFPDITWVFEYKMNETFIF